MKIESLKQCRICRSKNLETVVDLGEQCLSGKFPRVGMIDPLVTPLKLVQCTGQGCCGLVQLGHHMPMDELYGEGYGYLSGLNASMKKHLEDIAHLGESLVPLNSCDMVLDIGSNDGTLLRGYTHPNVCKVGMDARHFKKYYTDPDIVFIPEFFKKEVFFDDDKMKIITSIAMFYDLEDPNKFVADIKSLLHPDGVWIVEQLYLPKMLDNNAFDTICQEHLEYYSLTQMMWILEQHGLRVFKIEFTETNGNSFLLCICHKDAHWIDIDNILRILCDEERLDFEGFNKRVHGIKERLMGFLVSERAKGKTIHLYGASTKVNVLLQFFGIDTSIVSLAAERNKDKFHHMTPGTHIPIVSEDESRRECPDYYLVGPWHFRDGFITQLKDDMKRGTKLIFALPEPEVVSIEDGEVVVRPI